MFSGPVGASDSEAPSPLPAGAPISGREFVTGFTDRIRQRAARPLAHHLDGAGLEVDLHAGCRVDLLDRAGDRAHAVPTSHAFDLEYLVHVLLRPCDRRGAIRD